MTLLFLLLSFCVNFSVSSMNAPVASPAVPGEAQAGFRPGASSLPWGDYSPAMASKNWREPYRAPEQAEEPKNSGRARETKSPAVPKHVEGMKRVISGLAGFRLRQTGQEPGIPAYLSLPHMAAWRKFDSRADHDLHDYFTRNLPVDTCDSSGLTGLHLAVWYADLEGVKLFLKYNADSNIAEKHEAQTPLHTAVLRVYLDHVYIEIIQELLQAGADYNQKNVFGKSAHDLALFTRDQGILELFEQAHTKRLIN